jgi:ubiquinone/menaquinone biosynthesis C-methylase UbiE
MKRPSLNQLSEKIVLGYSLLRTTHFTLQQAVLPVFEFLATGQTQKRPTEYTQNLKKILPELYELLKKDAENIAAGLYPADVLKPETPYKHFLRYPRIIFDGYFVSKRRREKKAHDFNEEAYEFLKEVPEYYQRNFHFQSGGYLTGHSADLYEHQVEILFAGAADAMRRLILPPLKEKFPGEGEGLHFLEVAAGTGRLTRFVKLAFPKARITVMDLSDPYLKKARENLADFNRLDFLQGAAESLPFPEGSFDAVYSCFLFHELPLEIRRQALTEGLRVLKPGGFYGFVDSVQKEDAREFEWALERFPVDFHEPFFKNYLMNPMEGLMIHTGFKDVKAVRGFFSKAVVGRK